MKQKIENELLFTREVLCAMIERAVLDCKIKPEKYVRAHTRNFASKQYEEAVHFLKSDGFTNICFALGLPSDKLKRKAFAYDFGN
jgi:hypothetical protein